MIRQLLTESLLLASVGGALGILVGYWGKQLLPGPTGQAPLLDWRVLAFVLAVTGLTGIVFGIAPALGATGGDVNTALKQSSRSVAGSRSVLGKSLLVAQVAISLVLLVGAGLFLRTLHNLRHVDVGFNPQNLLLFRVQPQLNRYDEKRTAALYGQLLERIAAVPGVRAAALTNPALLTGSVNSTSIFVRGRVYANPRDSGTSINRLVISTNFFDVMEIPILLGRGFTARDDATAPKVVLINDAAAKKYFPNEDPIGQRFGSSAEDNSRLEIVGVIRDAKSRQCPRPAPPRCSCRTCRRARSPRSSPCGPPAIQPQPRAACAKPSGKSTRIFRWWTSRRSSSRSSAASSRKSCSHRCTPCSERSRSCSRRLACSA